jgi:hypothetical protein
VKSSATDQVQLLQGRELVELAAAQVGDRVVVEVEHEQLRQALERLVADADDAARVQVERRLRKKMARSFFKRTDEKQGCQMVYLQPKNFNLCMYFMECLGMEKFAIIYCH